MIGMLVTGVAMVCGLMFYVVDRNVTQKDNFMEIGGERKTVQLPSCRVLKLTQPPVVWKQKKEGIVEAERMFSFGEVPETLCSRAVSPMQGIWRLLCR